MVVVSNVHTYIKWRECQPLNPIGQIEGLGIFLLHCLQLTCMSPCYLYFSSSSSSRSSLFLKILYSSSLSIETTFVHFTGHENGGKQCAIFSFNAHKFRIYYYLLVRKLEGNCRLGEWQYYNSKHCNIVGCLYFFLYFCSPITTIIFLLYFHHKKKLRGSDAGRKKNYFFSLSLPCDIIIDIEAILKHLNNSTSI